MQKLLRDSKQSMEKKSMVIEIPEHKWKELLEEQEQDMLIFDIRSELLSRVEAECFRRFLERESIKFVVDCAHSAWKRIISLNFFYHDTTSNFYSNDSSWKADPAPECCKPDAWAKGNIILKPQKILIPEMPLDSKFSEYELVKCETYPTENLFEEPREEEVEEEVTSKQESMLVIHPQSSRTLTSEYNVEFELNEAFDDTREDSKSMKLRQSSEDIFYKLLRSKKLSLPSISIARVGMKKKFPPDWLSSDMSVESPQKINLATTRLNVTAQVRLPSISIRSVKEDKSAAFLLDGYKVKSEAVKQDEQI